MNVMLMASAPRTTDRITQYVMGCPFTKRVCSQSLSFSRTASKVMSQFVDNGNLRRFFVAGSTSHQRLLALLCEDITATLLVFILRFIPGLFSSWRLNTFKENPDASQPRFGLALAHVLHRLGC